jgi:hypothetical protein
MWLASGVTCASTVTDCSEADQVRVEASTDPIPCAPPPSLTTTARSLLRVTDEQREIVEFFDFEPIDPAPVPAASVIATIEKLEGSAPLSCKVRVIVPFEPPTEGCLVATRFFVRPGSEDGATFPGFCKTEVRVKAGADCKDGTYSLRLCFRKKIVLETRGTLKVRE